MTTILEQQTITWIILGAVQTKDIATRDGEEHVFMLNLINQTR
jgi:hypothetical protein